MYGVAGISVFPPGEVDSPSETIIPTGKWSEGYDWVGVIEKVEGGSVSV